MYCVALDVPDGYRAGKHGKMILVRAGECHADGVAAFEHVRRRLQAEHHLCHFSWHERHAVCPLEGMVWTNLVVRRGGQCSICGGRHAAPVWSKNSKGLKRRRLRFLPITPKCLLNGFPCDYNLLLQYRNHE